MEIPTELPTEATTEAPITDLLFDWSGEMRSIFEGDPVTHGAGVIPVLPSQFGINVAATYNSADESYAYPLNIGHSYVCETYKHYDPVYGPKIIWENNGKAWLSISFEAVNTTNNHYTFRPNTSVRNSNEMTVQLKIYEDRFYANYTLNGRELYTNAMATFDNSACLGFDICTVNHEGYYDYYRPKEQY